jgi:hypothetical protein
MFITRDIQAIQATSIGADEAARLAVATGAGAAGRSTPPRSCESLPVLSNKKIYVKEI